MADRMSALKTSETLLVSVIIPTRNRSGMLREALMALAEQTLAPSAFEVIVVDNCSTDDTPEMMPAIAAELPYQIVYHVMPSNRGPARSRNTAAKMAQAPILAFTDDDCRPDRRWLEASLAPFRDPQIALVSGKVLFKPEQVGKAGFFARDGREVLEEHPTYTWSNSCYRKDVFEQLEGSDESLCLADFRNRVVDCGDTDLAWRLKEAGFGNVFVHESVVYHELESMRPLNWICEPFRLFVVAELVRRHPGLRKQLLFGGVFFNRANVLLYLATAGVLLALAGYPMFLWLIAPYVIWAVLLLRPIISWSSAPKLVPQCLFLAARQVMLCAGMIYGSVRFRSLVL
jgi:glycosyltransferase involved in cell wall biosynthesis